MSNKEWDKISYNQSVKANTDYAAKKYKEMMQEFGPLESITYQEVSLTDISDTDMEILGEHEKRCACGKELKNCTCKNKKY